MDPEKAAPFELGSGRDAALLIHGFTGSPWDMRPLGEALADAGLHARGIRLPGHGLSPETMLTVSWRDWERAVFEALDELGAYRRVFVCGLSMGALLGVIAAAYRPDRVKGLALLAPAVAFRGNMLAALRSTRRLPLLHLARPWIEKDASDIADPVALKEAPILSSWPSARLYDLWTIQDRCAEAASRVVAPSLVMVAEHDHVVTPEGGEVLARSLRASELVRVVRISRGFHIMPRDHGREVVARSVCEFLSRL